MNNIRAKFEEIWPVPEGVGWGEATNCYFAWYHMAQEDAIAHTARLETFARCQEMMAIPEITKEQVFFALCCQMEDPSDDEEDGFNAGVSWCLAFIKQEIAKRNRK